MWEIYPHIHSQGIFKFDPYVLKFHIPLLSKTLVSKIDLKQDPLSMDPDERDTPTTIMMSWIQQSWQFIDPINGDHSMAHWIPPPTCFQGHLLNPYLGHRMEIVHQNRILVGHASMFRKFPCGNASHMFMVEEFAKLTPMCKNLTFPYWEKP